MPIPSEILSVKRPKNSVVICYGKNKDLYAVRERVGCKNVDGRHLPVNGATIGHIVNGEYIPIVASEPDSIASSSVDLKDWANVILCNNLFKDILSELKEVYNNEDSLKIYCIALLRVCNKGIKDCELKEAYDTSFLSELYPGVSLSKNTVSKFLNDLGKTVSRIVKFMKNRTSKVNANHHLLIDGTLKSNESKVNSLSDFSRKARTKGTKDISILFAFDLEIMEPICSQAFPGNMLDATSYQAFIKDNGITKGIIVADKGFPQSAAGEQFEANSDLHYLNPIKRNSKLIENHDMLSFSNILPGFEGITYKKAACTGNKKWLYSFRDAKKAAKEEADWLKRVAKDKSYDFETLQAKQKSFGTIVLECDLDLEPEIVYRAYSSRWEIELVMRYYKSACEFDETRVHDDYSVIGSEFCDFLSTVLTFRLIKAFDKSKLLEDYTYKKLMQVLIRAKKIHEDNKHWRLIKMNPSQLEILEKLNIIEKKEVSSNTSSTEANKRGRGRPKGSKNKKKT